MRPRGQYLHLLIVLGLFFLTRPLLEDAKLYWEWFELLSAVVLVGALYAVSGERLAGCRS